MRFSLARTTTATLIAALAVFGGAGTASAHMDHPHPHSGALAVGGDSTDEDGAALAVGGDATSLTEEQKGEDCDEDDQMPADEHMSDQNQMSDEDHMSDQNQTPDAGVTAS